MANDLAGLFKKVNEIDTQIDYWFIRTDGGEHFETYLKDKFIAIGWNSITLDDLNNKGIEEIKAKISRTEGLDPGTSYGKSKITAIYNKLVRFNKLRKNDIIIIPSYGSDRYAFGIIVDNITYSATDGPCPHRKRRKVKWIEVKEVKDLDPIFYKIKTSRHAISAVKDYAAYIDKAMDNLYFKDGASHYIIDVQKKDDISLKSLVGMVSNLEKLMSDINNEFQLEEDDEIEASSIKLNLQSPGSIEVILKKGKSLAILAALLLIHSCGNSDNIRNIPEAEKKALEKYANTKSADLDTIKHDMDTLNVNWDKVNSAY